MSRLRVHTFTVSVDGYGAGPNQSVANPLGEGAETLHKWMLPTRTFQTLMGNEGGETGVDDEFTAGGLENIGAWIIGRNMFGPIRGDWPDDEWKGWWGDEPPYHVPVFVLTNHIRDPITMKGGTVFHFVTDGIEAALARAREAADGRDVRVGGGVSTIRQYLQAKLIDELHLAVSPVLLGSGEHLLRDIDLVSLGYDCSQHATTPNASHVVITKAHPESS